MRVFILLDATGTGALVMRGAGCTVNDLWDRDIDKKVARTKNRPLASGALQPYQVHFFILNFFTTKTFLILKFYYYKNIISSTFFNFVLV